MTDEGASLALATVLVAIAGPIGVALGWWLSRRAEHERQAREERKVAYVDFIKSATRFRNADPDDRVKMRHERWAALAPLILVAPPHVFKEAWALTSAGDELLDHDHNDPRVAEIHRAMWQHFSGFSKLARADLGIRADPFGEQIPVAAAEPAVAPPERDA